MGIIQEFADLVGKLRFFKIVHQYEKGLLFSNGVVVPLRKRYHGEELEKIVSEERQIAKQHGGSKRIFLDYFLGKTHNYPEGWNRNWLGQPRHPDRNIKDKNLYAGTYFFLPVFRSVVTEVCKEKGLDLADVGVITTDESHQDIMVSCNLRYEIDDFYTAYTEVQDHEVSLSRQVISDLARLSRGHTFQEWVSPEFVDGLAEKLETAVEEVVTKRWGLRVYDIEITHTVKATYHKFVYETNSTTGNGVNLSLPPSQDDAQF